MPVWKDLCSLKLDSNVTGWSDLSVKLNH